MKVSVIVTLYNYEEYIGKCIQSFLSQNFHDSEMIIVDDCSTDDSCKVVEKYESSRVRCIRLRENGNYSHAKNIGIKCANAEILVMLDADDMLTENGITSRYEKIQEGFDLVHGPCIVVQDNGSRRRGTIWGKYLKTGNPRDIHAQTVMLRKDIHRKIGLYDETLWNTSDREMWIRIHNHNFKIGYVNEDVSIYRMHSKQMHRSDEKQRVLKATLALVEEQSEKRKTDLTDLEMLK